MHRHDSRHNNIISNILPGNHQNTTRNSNSTGQIVYSFTTGNTSAEAKGNMTTSFSDKTDEFS